MTKQLSKKLADRSTEAGDVIWSQALWDAPEEQCGEPSSYSRLTSFALDLEWAEKFLERAANALERQSPRWPQAERFEQRVIHAHVLSSVYQWGFGKEPAIISWHGQPEGDWPDFFQRIMQLAFGEKKTPNLENVLGEARKRFMESGGLLDMEKLFE